MSIRRVLEELALERFEPAICCRIRGDDLESLVGVRYEDLLEMGLSKVQCHLFLQKVSSLLAPALNSDRVIEMPLADLPRVPSSGSLGSADCRDLSHTPPLKEEALGSSAAAPLSASMLGDELRRRLMPPPSSTNVEVPQCYSRKRPRSSHLSTAGATVDPLASEQLSTAGSASGSSSSSLHQDLRVGKRRRVWTWSRSGRRRSSGAPSSRDRGLSSVPDLHAGVTEQALADLDLPPSQEWNSRVVDSEHLQNLQMLLQEVAREQVSGST